MPAAQMCPQAPPRVKKLVTDGALQRGRKVLGVMAVPQRVEAHRTQRPLSLGIRTY